LRTPPSPAGH